MKLRAIAIDDDPTSTLTLKQIVEKIEEVTLVNTYQDSVDGAAGIVIDKPDLLFLDIEMPDFNGIDIMESLVKPPKIIVISGNPSFEGRAKALNAVTFVHKPPTEAEVRKAVGKVLEVLSAEV